MTRRNLHSKRYIGLLRCSSPGQTDTSIGDQRRLLEAFAREQGMVCADYIELEGVSGSIPGNRSDIEELVRRKNDRDDFEVLLVQDTSRFTRGGIQHAHHIESELNAAGIEVVYAQIEIPAGDTGDLIKSVHAFADQHQAKSISLSSTRGSMSSLQDDRSAYCRRPPYGIDKLYLSPDGNPLHIIRNLPDGRQLMMHPETKELITTFGVNEATGVPNHYLKQKQERVQLIPGDPKCVEVVQRIYHRHYVDDWGRYRIAKELNEEGIPSPTGNKWSTYTVRTILLNPIYLGRGIANRFTSAIYHMRSPDRPLDAKVDKRELYSRKRPAVRIRKGSDWHEQLHESLEQLLDPELRALAAERQAQHLANQASGHTPKPNRDRHKGSKYVLKGILRSKQGDHLMTGIQTGKKTSKKRYYRVSPAYNKPDGDKTLRKLIPAEPLEQAVLETVKTTLLSLPDLREKLESQVRSILKERDQSTQDRDRLLAEREALRQKLEMIVDQFDPGMQELTAGKIERLRARLRSIDQRLSQCGKPVKADNRSVEVLVERSLKAIEEIPQMMAIAPPATLSQYLKVLISDLVVDLETREVVMKLALPTVINADDFKMCLVEGFPYKSYNETHTIIGLFRLQWCPRDYCFRPATAA